MNTPIQHILFPTDYSDAADNAYRYCLELAKLFKTKVSVLHIYFLPDIEDIKLPGSLQAVYDNLRKEEENKLQEKIPHWRRIASEMGISDLEIEYSIIEGEVPDDIYARQEAIGADLIIMGTQGASIVEKYFLGNNTANVMENASVPVLGIPPNAMLMDVFSSLVVCTDFSENDKEILKIVLALFPDFNDTITTFHISKSDKKSELKEEWVRFCGKLNVEFVDILASSFVKGIQKYDNKYGMHILVMRTHVKNALNELFNRDIAKDMIYSKTVPILAIPEKYREKHDEAVG